MDSPDKAKGLRQVSPIVVLLVSAERAFARQGTILAGWLQGRVSFMLASRCLLRVFFGALWAPVQVLLMSSLGQKTAGVLRVGGWTAHVLGVCLCRVCICECTGLRLALIGPLAAAMSSCNSPNGWRPVSSTELVLC